MRLCLLLFITAMSPMMVVAYRASLPMAAVKKPISPHQFSRMSKFKAARPYISDRYMPRQMRDDLYEGTSALKSCYDRYNLEIQLSAGAIAFAFKGRDVKKSNAPVIIKIFLIREAFDQEALSFDVVAMGKRIFEAAHPPDSPGAAAATSEEKSPWKHFVRLLDRCHFDGQPALVIEFLEEVLSNTIMLHPLTKYGSSEASRDVSVQSSESSAASPKRSIISNPARQFRWYAYQLLTALDALHEVGIAHLDVKPDNIGLTVGGTVKLFDFQTVCTSSPRHFVGTVEYSAPEMNLGVAITHGDKMDAWSVGCTIYEIFAGEVLFHGIRDFSVLRFYLSRASPNINCFFKAAYFYVLWSSGAASFAKYEADETLAKTSCPRIFGDAGKKELQIDSPRIFAYAYPNESPLKVSTEIRHKMNGFLPAYSADNTRLEPSNTRASDLVELLSGMLQFDEAERLSVRSALTQNRMFREYGHQNTANG